MSEAEDTPEAPAAPTKADQPKGFQVVLVGRPNVGKSALFNRIAGSRRALVHDRPGMTRDALEISARTGNGRPFRLVDTGGLDLDAAGGFAAWTSERALATVADADLILFVLDGVDGLLPEDRRISAKLHALGKRVVVVWNKMDTRKAQEAEAESHELGFPTVVSVSALHGIGAAELDDAIEEALPETIDPELRIHALPIAIVGRPNVGKSSIVNAILGKNRVMVSEIAGTTRDAIDVRVSRGEREYIFVDTAGIRRKGKTEDPAEKLSIISARKAMERARIVIFVFDAAEGITAQDQHILGYAEESGCGLLLVANKWDLIEGDAERIRHLKDDVKFRFVFARGAAFLTVSALKGRGISKILPEADALAKRYATKLSTGELNRILQKAFQQQAPKGKSGKDMKIRYAVQVGSEPPVIRLFSDRSEPLYFSFERFLQNRIRDHWRLDGIPVRFVVRKSE
ncbi:MAG: ribosome biogenesis GTPase Der [Thermoanaerobaculia bacterium]